MTINDGGIGSVVEDDDDEEVEGGIVIHTYVDGETAMLRLDSSVARLVSPAVLILVCGGGFLFVWACCGDGQVWAVLTT